MSLQLFSSGSKVDGDACLSINYSCTTELFKVCKLAKTYVREENVWEHLSRIGYLSFRQTLIESFFKRQWSAIKCSRMSDLFSLIIVSISKGSSDTVRMPKFVSAFAVHLCDIKC